MSSYGVRQSKDDTALPAGWILSQKPAPHSEAWTCANRALGLLWAVSGKNEIALTKYSPDRPAQWQLPFVLNLSEMLPDANEETRKHARRHVMKIEKGGLSVWMLASGVGAYGGTTQQALSRNWETRMSLVSCL